MKPLMGRIHLPKAIKIAPNALNVEALMLNLWGKTNLPRVEMWRVSEISAA
jgi:hypothetical protein